MMPTTARVASGNGIALRGETAPVVVPRRDVFFAFASGRLKYDCVECDAKCCRGNGYLLTLGTELGTQLSTKRGLPLFLEPAPGKGATQLQMVNCQSGCFFLTDRGLCEIHARHGRSAKPETCRLFPFNNFCLVGRYLVVAPHPWLCPIEIAASEAKCRESVYDELLDAMGEFGISAPISRVMTGAYDPDRVIACEREIVSTSEQFLERSYADFVKAQVEIETQVRPEGFDTSEARLAYIGEFARQLLDTPSSQECGQDGKLVRTMVAMTPFLRSQFVFNAAGPGLRRGLVLERAKVPFALFGLYLLSESARRAGVRAMTYQTISKLHKDFMPLVQLIADLDAVVVWSRGASIEMPSVGDSGLRLAFLRLAKALLPDRQRKYKLTLGAVLLEHAPHDPVQRIIFAKEAARIVLGKTVPLGEESRSSHPSMGSRPIRGAVYRWALSNMSESVLEAAYSRVQNTST